MRVDNLHEHGVRTSIPIEVEGDDDDNNGIVEHILISINDDDGPATAEAFPPPW